MPKIKENENHGDHIGLHVQTDTALLDVTCCVRLHILLHVVGSCCAKFETGQTLSYV